MIDLFKKILFAFIPLLAAGGVLAQPATCDGLRSPFDFEILLSASYGELRSNHFHAGLDFKTGGVVGKQIKCVADGYICRAKVEAAGYGLALYVMHDGYMTVYAHLDRFPDAIAKRVRKYQYDNECFEVDLYFAPDDYPVKRGEFLAYAGNTGYSFGPHLHFELRDASGNRLFNPLPYFKELVTDTRAPKATAMAVYPRLGCGALFAESSSKSYELKGNVLPDTIEAWGDIAFGIEALDYMNNTTNKYGLYSIELLVDSVLCFEMKMDSYTFSENKLILACVDQARERLDKGTFQKLFKMPNNSFSEYKAGAQRGWVTVDEERLYNVECRIADYHGNSSSYKAVVRGVRCEIPQPVRASEPLLWNKENFVKTDGAHLSIPKGEMFDDACLDIVYDDSCTLSGGCFSTDEDVIFWHGAKLSLKVGDDVADIDKRKLYIGRKDSKGISWVGGKYSDGWLTATISSQGVYDIAVDTIPPVLKPVKEASWEKNAKVVFDLDDKETKIASFRGTLNGKFVLFKYNRKERRLTFDFKQENIKSGTHKLKVVATDVCGNTAVFEKSIRY
ncbi:MAG: M23 family metallopeptidase [Bacteroidaceae bacterium]|nr:M23 family metallopeptidase [Bacteroidaceae bacterium]